MLKSALLIAGLAAVAAAQAQHDSTFDAPPAQVLPSPKAARFLALPAGAEALAMAGSADRPRTAVALRQDRTDSVWLWDAGAAAAKPIWRAPSGSAISALAWDSFAERLYLLAHVGDNWKVLRLELAATQWRATAIFAGRRELKGLAVAPRPFDTGEQPFARLFFGERKADGTYRTLSITTEGKRLYQVIGPKATAIPVGDPRDIQPASLPAPNAVPVGFYPAGNRMLWEDGNGCFQSAFYGDQGWGKLAPLASGKQCSGSLAVTPNGLGLIHWRAGAPGVSLTLVMRPGPEPQATSVEFVLPPSSTPDGRGLLGVIRTKAGESLAYVPITVPLADVANAWMFVTRPQELGHFQRDDGLLRPYAAQPGSPDELYSFYDTELYSCGGLDPETPTRPYLVTTDLMWEVYGAAFHGLFTLSERQQGVPEFWRFVIAAGAELRKERGGGNWAAVFATMADLRNPHPASPEARRVIVASGYFVQPQFGKDLDYSQFRPRGYYAGDPQMAAYFRAFRYFTAVADVAPDLAPLSGLNPSAKALALAWIGAYIPFIAPPRQPLLWGSDGEGVAPYARHPGQGKSVFPLSWGFDNEVLNSTAFHRGWPAAEQITGVRGPRLLPSGLDVAAVLGNRLAKALLAPQLREYGRLGPVLGRLQSQAAAGALRPQGDFYEQWLRALRTQWAPSPRLDGKTSELWAAKRLVTGLASWATLRHLTVLVNDETAAECGEGGFEELITAPPRGYVEPDPATFAAIAGLFDAMAARLAGSSAAWTGAAPEADNGTGPANESLRTGILRRLHEASANAALFASIARKEQAGQALRPSDYLAILYAGRAGEYDFLVFKSLANRNYALSIPDPLPKVADVAGDAATGFLEEGIGDGMEWDQIVPFFGRHEIVKGSVYSYREVVNRMPLSDAKWRAVMLHIPPPAWVSKYIVPNLLVCPAVSPF